MSKSFCNRTPFFAVPRIILAGDQRGGGLAGSPAASRSLQSKGWVPVKRPLHLMTWFVFFIIRGRNLLARTLRAGGRLLLIGRELHSLHRRRWWSGVAALLLLVERAKFPGGVGALLERERAKFPGGVGARGAPMGGGTAARVPAADQRSKGWVSEGVLCYAYRPKVKGVPIDEEGGSVTK